jgi:hypothetical protein
MRNFKRLEKNFFENDRKGENSLKSAELKRPFR